MITKRQGVFETNSSSSHSLTIKYGEEWDTITPDFDGVITLNGDEFGWGWDKYNDAFTKANYFAVDNQHNEERIELLRKVIKDYTNCNDVVIEISEGAYIDHESYGTTSEIYTEDQLRQFIFNKASWLFIGNDNGGAPNKFYDDPNLPYTHQVRIDLPDGQVLTWDLQGIESINIEEIIGNMMDDVIFIKSKNQWIQDEYYWRHSETYYQYLYDSVDEETETFEMAERFNKDSDHITLNYKFIEL